MNDESNHFEFDVDMQKVKEELEEIETEDKIEYQEYWLLTKLARVVNRFDKEEALKAKKSYEKLSQRQKEKEEVLGY